MNTGYARVDVFVTGVGAVVSVWLGGFDVFLKLFAFLLVADYISGILAALKLEKRINTDVMFWGFIKKAACVCVIALAVLFDQSIGTPIFRSIALFFFISKEGFSVVENFGKLGVKFPEAMTRIFTEMEQKGNEIPGTVLPLEKNTHA